MASKQIAKWHYRLGTVSAIFVLLMAVTGILINHTDRLKLNRQYVESQWLLDWYQIAPKSRTVSYGHADFYASKIDQRLFLSNGKFVAKEIANTLAALRGIVVSQRLVLLATSSEVILLTRKGQLVERITASANQWGGIQAIGLMQQAGLTRVVIKTSKGILQADNEIGRWTLVDGEKPVRWSQPVTVPDRVKLKLLEAYRGKGLTVERILLDVHTGRILGNWGVYLMDLAAIIFIVLAITGITVWLRRRGNIRQRLQSNQR